MKATARLVLLFAFGLWIGSCGGSYEAALSSQMELGPLEPDLPAMHSTPFTLQAYDASQIVGKYCTVRFKAVEGTPFLKGTSAEVDVKAKIVSSGMVEGMSPTAVICGESEMLARITLILPSGYMAESDAPIARFMAPVVERIDLETCPALSSPRPFTAHGSYLKVPPAADPSVKIHWKSDQTIFKGGTADEVTTVGMVVSAGALTGFTPPVVICGPTESEAQIEGVEFSDGSCAFMEEAPKVAFLAPLVESLDVAECAALDTPKSFVATGQHFEMPPGASSSVTIHWQCDETVFDNATTTETTSVGTIASDQALTGETPEVVMRGPATARVLITKIVFADGTCAYLGEGPLEVNFLAPRFAAIAPDNGHLYLNYDTIELAGLANLGGIQGQTVDLHWTALAPVFTDAKEDMTSTSAVVRPDPTIEGACPELRFNLPKDELEGPQADEIRYYRVQGTLEYVEFGSGTRTPDEDARVVWFYPFKMDDTSYLAEALEDRLDRIDCVKLLASASPARLLTVLEQADAVDDLPYVHPFDKEYWPEDNKFEDAYAWADDERCAWSRLIPADGDLPGFHRGYSMNPAVHPWRYYDPPLPEERTSPWGTRYPPRYPWDWDEIYAPWIPDSDYPEYQWIYDEDWDDETDNTSTAKEWRTQGTTGFWVKEKQWLVVSWYHLWEKSYIDDFPKKGARLSFIDTSTSPPRYRHVLLVQPSCDGSSADPRVFKTWDHIHAGGIAAAEVIHTEGEMLLYLAFNRTADRGFLVFDMNRIFKVGGKDAGKCGFHDGEAHALGYEYVMPQIRHVTLTRAYKTDDPEYPDIPRAETVWRAPGNPGYRVPPFQYVSMDRTDPDQPRLLTGQVVLAGQGPADRDEWPDERYRPNHLVWWDIDSTGRILGESKRVGLHHHELKCAGINGAACYGETLYLNRVDVLYLEDLQYDTGDVRYDPGKLTVMKLLGRSAVTGKLETSDLISYNLTWGLEDMYVSTFKEDKPRIWSNTEFWLNERWPDKDWKRKWDESDDESREYHVVQKRPGGFRRSDRYVYAIDPSKYPPR